MKSTLIALAAAATLMSSAAALAGPAPAAIAGTWRGTTTGDNSMPVPITLTLPASGESSVTFGAPYSCKLVVDYVGSASRAHTLSITRSNGGKCDGALRGAVVLKESGAGLIITVARQNGATLLQGQLNK